MNAVQRVWRSMLFLPAHVEKYTARAHERGADAVVLDLEDSVPLALKAPARAGVRAVAQRIDRAGTDVLVRINGSASGNGNGSGHDDDAMADLEAVVCTAVKALVLPKVANAGAVDRVATRLDAIEASHGVPRGHTRLIALIEDVHALAALDSIAGASPRMIGMTLGPEDFSVSAGSRPTQQALMLPSQMVQFACRRAGILPFGFPGSIGEFVDLEKLRAQVLLARELGFVGALCVHPAQVPVLNVGFSPSDDELADARAVLAACEAALAAGRGAAEHRGKMIDPPVVARAQELLRRAAAPH